MLQPFHMYYALCIKCNQSKKEAFHKNLALTLPLSSVKYCESRQKKKKSHRAYYHSKLLLLFVWDLRCLALGTGEEEQEGGIVRKRDGFTWKIQLSGHLNPGKDWYCFECMGDHLGSRSGLTYKILIKNVGNRWTGRFGKGWQKWNARSALSGNI